MNFLIGLVSLFSIGCSHTAIDTTDHWHVFYNHKPIAGDRNPVIVLAKKNIKAKDELTVKYFADAPCSECLTEIYVVDQNLRTTVFARGTGTFSPLEIPVSLILRTLEKTKKNLLEIYYSDTYRKMLIFKIILKN
jgi:hypothetical protein